MTNTTKQYPNERDCEHGRQRGKCDICDLIEAEKQIEQLQARCAELERIKLEWEQVVQPAYDYVDKSGIGELGKSKLGCLVESHEKLQAKIEAVRLEQGNGLVIREVWRIVEPDTKEQGE
jgi:hypothetical protein